MAIEEQICSGDSDGKWKRRSKNRANRILRREAKRDPENAEMKKRYRGYST